jgi:hypothetical protein
MTAKVPRVKQVADHLLERFPTTAYTSACSNPSDFSGIQPQGSQCFCAGVQQELHSIHTTDVHITKSDSAKQVNHGLRKAHLPEIHQRQSSPQRRSEGWDERHVVSCFVLRIEDGMKEFEIL